MNISTLDQVVQERSEALEIDPASIYRWSTC